MNKSKKKIYKQKFSDQQVYDQIKGQLQQIRQRNLKQIDEIQQIGQLYEKAKMQKQKRMIMKNSGNLSLSNLNIKIKSYSDTEQQDEQLKANRNREMKGHHEQQQLQEINRNVVHLIKSIILTKNRVAEIMTLKNCRQILIGCFVRYQDVSILDGTKKYYVLARITEIIEGGRQYIVNNIKLKHMLTLQQSSSMKDVTLSVPLIQDKIKQNTSGNQIDQNLEIQKWIVNNKKAIPSQAYMKQKKQELQKIQLNLSKSNSKFDNLLLKCKKIVQANETSQDINYLIDFLSQKIDNLDLDIQKIRNFNARLNHDEKIKIRDECKMLLQKIKKIQEKYFKEKQAQKKADLYLKKKMFYNQQIKKVKRKDQIHQKIKVKQFLFKTAEGCKKIQMNLIENHKMYDLHMD